MRACAVALRLPCSATSSTRLWNSSTWRMFSRARSGPTILVVILSDAQRTTLRTGATSLTHTLIGPATIPAATRRGSLTAIVLGVTSPKRRSSGSITTMLSQPARASPKRAIRIPVMFATAAMFTSSFPQRIETMSLRGSSSSEWRVRAWRCLLLRTWRRSMGDRENRAVSDPEKKADANSRATWIRYRASMSASKTLPASRAPSCSRLMGRPPSVPPAFHRENSGRCRSHRPWAHKP